MSDLKRASPPLIIDFYREQSLIDGCLLGPGVFRLPNLQFLADPVAYVLADIEYNPNPLGSDRMNFRSAILDAGTPPNFLERLFEQQSVKDVVQHLSRYLDYIMSPHFVHNTGNVFRITSYLAGLLVASLTSERYTVSVLVPKVPAYRLSFLVTDTTTSTSIHINPIEFTRFELLGDNVTPPIVGSRIAENTAGTVVPEGKILVLNIQAGFDNGRTLPVDYVSKRVDPATVDLATLENCFDKSRPLKVVKLAESVNKVVRSQMTMEDLVQPIHQLILICDHVMNSDYELNSLLDGLLHYEHCQKSMPLELAHEKRPLNALLIHGVNLPVFFNIRKIVNTEVLWHYASFAHRHAITVNVVHYLDSRSGRAGRASWAFLHAINEDPRMAVVEPSSCLS